MHIKIILSFIICFSLFSTPALAVSPSPSSSPKPTLSPTSTPESSDSAKQSIRDRIEKVKNTNDPQVQGAMTNLRTPKFAFVGTLEKIVGQNLQIKTYKGTVQIVELDKQSVLLKNNKTIKFEDLELNSNVIVMGFRLESAYLGKRLIITDEGVIPPKRATIFGKVKLNQNKSILISTFASPNLLDLEIAINTKTKYFNLIDNTIKKTDFKPNDSLIAVFTGDYTATTSAIRIYSLSDKLLPTPSP